MTQGIGAITGSVVVCVRGQSDTKVYVDVAYTGTEEFHSVIGSPLQANAHLADQIVAHLSSDLGTDADGNPAARTLTDLQ